MANSNQDADSAKEELAKLFDLIQQQRVDSIDRVRDVSLSTRALFQAEAARLTRKVGADDARVRRFTARATQGLDLIGALESEAQIARVRSPIVDRADALIQGRILDARGAGVAGADVRVVDANGKDAGLGVVKTDAAGYYAITVPAAVVEKLPAGQSLRLEVAGDQGRVIPEAGGVFALAAGDRQLREVKLSTTELKRVRVVVDPRLGDGLKIDPGIVKPGVVVTPAEPVKPVVPVTPVVPVRPGDPGVVVPRAVAPAAAKSAKAARTGAASKAAEEASPSTSAGPAAARKPATAAAKPAVAAAKPTAPTAKPATASAKPKRPAAKKKPGS